MVSRNPSRAFTFIVTGVSDALMKNESSGMCFQSREMFVAPHAAQATVAEARADFLARD